MRYSIVLLRVLHGLFVVYFLFCIAYIYYAVFAERYDALLVVAIVSLGLEGIAVFGLNGGDCPLIHIQKHAGDETPFFELVFPPRLAKLTLRICAVFALLGVALLLLKYLWVVI